MASYTLMDVFEVFPVATEVGAYEAANWRTAGLPPSGAPQGSTTATATVDAGGELAFTGLAAGTPYFAAAQVSGTWRYQGFTAPDDTTPSGLDARMDAAEASLISVESSSAEQAVEISTKLPTTSRPDEALCTAVRLGPFVGESRFPIFVAASPCRVKHLTLVASSTAPLSLSSRWDVVWVRRALDYLSTKQLDATMDMGPVRYFRLDDTGTPVVDPEADAAALGPTTVCADETGSANGLHVGSPTLQVAGAPGGFQTAVEYDGTGAQYSRMPAADLAYGNEVTISLWVRPDVAVISDAAQQHPLGADAATGTGRPAALPVVVIRPSADGEPNGVSIWTPGGYVLQSSNWRGLTIGEMNLIWFVRDHTPNFVGTLTNEVTLPAATIYVTPTSGSPVADGFSAPLDIGGQAVTFSDYEYAGYLSGCAGGIGTFPAGTAVTQTPRDELYVNGKRLQAVYPAAVNFVDESHRIVIGKSRSQATPDYPFDGAVDEVAIFPTARSLDEHRDLYAAMRVQSTKDVAMTRRVPWLQPSRPMNPNHVDLNAGDVVWVEATPLNQAVAIDDVTAFVWVEPTAEAA